MPNGGHQHRENARHRQAFEEWYAANRDFPKAAETCAVLERTLRNWGYRFGWEARADHRDREAAARADREAIRRRAAMLLKCRQAGELLVGRGVERLANKPIEAEAVAVNAIVKGIEVWRTAEGLPAWVLGVLSANPEELEAMERELDARRRAAAAPGEVAEAGTPQPPALVSGNGRG